APSRVLTSPIAQARREGFRLLPRWRRAVRRAAALREHHARCDPGTFGRRSPRLVRHTVRGLLQLPWRNGLISQPGGLVDVEKAEHRADALLDEYERTRDMPTLKQAVALYHQAATATPRQAPERARRMGNLAVALLRLSRRTSDVTLLR